MMFGYKPCEGQILTNCSCQEQILANKQLCVIAIELGGDRVGCHKV